MFYQGVAINVGKTWFAATLVQQRKTPFWQNALRELRKSLTHHTAIRSADQPWALFLRKMRSGSFIPASACSSFTPQSFEKHRDACLALLRDARIFKGSRISLQVLACDCDILVQQKGSALGLTLEPVLYFPGWLADWGHVYSQPGIRARSFYAYEALRVLFDFSYCSI